MDALILYATCPFLVFYRHVEDIWSLLYVSEILSPSLTDFFRGSRMCFRHRHSTSRFALVPSSFFECCMNNTESLRNRAQEHTVHFPKTNTSKITNNIYYSFDFEIEEGII